VSTFACDACGAEVLDIDVKCPRCGRALAATAAQEMIGNVVLGQYAIDEVIGQGGMSVVYRAHRTMTDQEVALKILPPELAAHSQVKSRFLEEARALAQLDHPNIVHLYNFGQEGGCFVLAMQFVHGSTFERLILEAGRLPWERATRIAVDVLKALEYAHARGIIHRDMKPSNVLVRDRDGSATVMDFGIAKMTTSSKLTATGQTMGTVRYMSPEQVRGKEVDLRTDIYSLGGSVYEAVVGDTPFDGETHFEIMTKHLHEIPKPPSACGVAVPDELEAALMRSLSKKPEDRFGSATEMREAFERLLEDTDLGEAKTLRMSRDGLGPPPALAVGEAARGGAEEDTRDLKGVASTAETGEQEESAAVRELADMARAGRRRPWWLLLAALVVVASAGVVIALLLGGEPAKSTTSGRSADASEPEPAPSWPKPFQLSGVTYAVDETYEADRVHVLSVAPMDPERVRAAVVNARARFVAFLRERGFSGEVQAQPLTVVLVPHEVLCDDRIYREPQKPEAKAPATCGEDSAWYRPHEKTLFVDAGAERLEASVAFNVALAVCLHSVPRIALCDGRLLEDFDDRQEAAEQGPSEDGERGKRDAKGPR